MGDHSFSCTPRSQHPLHRFLIGRPIQGRPPRQLIGYSPFVFRVIDPGRGFIAHFLGLVSCPRSAGSSAPSRPKRLSANADEMFAEALLAMARNQPQSCSLRISDTAAAAPRCPVPEL